MYLVFRKSDTTQIKDRGRSYIGTPKKKTAEEKCNKERGRRRLEGEHFIGDPTRDLISLNTDRELNI